MMNVHPIRKEQITEFIQTCTDPATLSDVESYLHQLFSSGSSQVDWCFIAEEAGQFQGRVAYWTLPKSGKPSAIVLLDLPWESEQFLSIGNRLLRDSLASMSCFGAEKIGYVLDTPELPPQWQRFSEKRIKLLEHTGFRTERETFRFEWSAPIGYNPKTSDILFRTLSEVGENTFVEAVMRVSESTLDQSINQERANNGAERQARSMFAALQQMEYDPSWWQLAYTPHGELIGIVMPTKNPTYATIGYIGVVPEHRGRGYIDILLNRGTSLLNKTGASIIRADTDVNNIPMANAFKRAGYVQFAKRREFSLQLGDV